MASVSSADGSSSRGAFVTLLTARAQGRVRGALAIARSLRRHESSFPLVVATTPDLPEELLQTIQAEPNVVLKRLGWREPPEEDAAVTRSATHHVESDFALNYSKMRLWELTEYSKLVYLDPEVLPLQNIDDMMLAPAFSAVLDSDSLAKANDILSGDETFHQVPAFHHPKSALSLNRNKEYFSAGVFVFEPSMAELGAMLSRLADCPPSRCASDQDFLNDFFNGSSNILPPSFNWSTPNFWLCPELCPSAALKVVRFSAQCKPWLRNTDGTWSAENAGRVIGEERDQMLQPTSRLSRTIDYWWSCYGMGPQGTGAAVVESDGLQAVVDAQSQRVCDTRPACFATFLSGAGDYYKGVLGLKGSLDRTGTELPLIVAVTSDVPQKQREMMEAAGCQLRNVEVTLPETLNGKPKLDLYMLCYAKLQLWLWEEFRTVVYLDADTAVSSSIDSLAALKVPVDHIAASLDWGFATSGTGRRNGGPYFNAGVMVFSPSEVTYNRMMAALQADGTIGDYAEQDMLNDFFRGRFIQLPEAYNFIQDYLVPTSLPPPARQQELVCGFRSQLPKVVHYAGAKPWRGSLCSQLLQKLRAQAKTADDQEVVAEAARDLDRIAAEWNRSLEFCQNRQVGAMVASAASAAVALAMQLPTDSPGQAGQQRAAPRTVPAVLPLRR